MKKYLYIFLFIFLAAGCGDKKSSSLPDDLEKALTEYLNYEAWCHPSDFPQEETRYFYHIYQKKEQEPKFSQIFLKLEGEEESAWYCCTYTRQENYCIEPWQEAPEEVEETGSGELTIPEVSRPEFEASSWTENEIGEIQKALDSSGI